MKGLIFSLSIILFATIAVADSWTDEEEILFVVFGSLQIADAYQTSLISKNDSISEGNGLYARNDGNPDMAIVLGSKILMTSLIWYSLNASKNKDRKNWLWILNFFQSSLVFYNAGILMTINF